jgi:hypothetical protein
LKRLDDFRMTAREMFKRFEGEADKDKMVQLLTTCLSVPKTLDDPEVLVTEAKRLQANGGPDRLLGAALVRAGKAKDALPYLEQSRIAWDWAFAALAHHHLGDETKALPFLAKIKSWMAVADNQPFGAAPNRWSSPRQRVELQTLVREIEGLLPEKNGQRNRKEH